MKRYVHHDQQYTPIDIRLVTVDINQLTASAGAVTTVPVLSTAVAGGVQGRAAVLTMPANRTHTAVSSAWCRQNVHNP